MAETEGQPSTSAPTKHCGAMTGLLVPVLNEWKVSSRERSTWVVTSGHSASAAPGYHLHDQRRHRALDIRLGRARRQPQSSRATSARCNVRAANRSTTSRSSLCPRSEEPAACSGGGNDFRHRCKSLRRTRFCEPLVKPSTDLLRRQLRTLSLLTDDDDTSCRDAGETGDTQNLP